MSTVPHTRNFFNSIGEPDDIGGDGTEILSIAICRQYVRYYISSGSSGTLVFYGDYTLHSDDVAAQLAAILSKDTFLNKSFREVRICWFTAFEIIPSVFFDASELSAGVLAEKIMDGEANFIFEVPQDLNTLLKDKFNSITHYHSGAVLIERIRQNGLAAADKIFINVHADSIEILCFDDNGTLRIYNRYEYKAYQDYIYYVLLVADEMKINREEVKAVLMGEISRESQLYEITHRYFMDVLFMEQPAGVHFSTAFGDYPAHLNYPLYNL